VLPLAFRFPFAPALALSVRGLTALEDAEVVDVDAAHGGEEIRRSEVTRGLMVVCLLANGRPAFGSPEEVDELTEDETDALLAAVAPAFNTVSPLRRRIDLDAWQEVLRRGAQHPLNISAAATVAAATRTVIGFSGVVRESAPERYFGLPLADLTDGQILAYSAAKAVFDK
jgi:hypothetical protein